MIEVLKASNKLADIEKQIEGIRNELNAYISQTEGGGQDGTITAKQEDRGISFNLESIPYS